MRFGWLALVGCSAGGVEEDTAPGGSTACSFVDPDDLGDVENGLFGREHACESQPQYEEFSDFNWLTVYYVGKFDLDGCGAVTGQEIWKIYPSPRVADQGMSDCDIVFRVFGTRGEPVDRGDFSVNLTAEVDLEATDCVALGGSPFYLGDETYEVVYDVDVDAGGAATVYFPPSEFNGYQGAVLGSGFGNQSHVSYLSDFVCSPYTF